MESQQINPNPEETKPKSNYSFVYILIFIFIALLCITIYLYFQNSKQEIIQNTKINNKEVYLYPNLKWKESNLNNDTFDIYIDNYDYEKDSSKAKSQSISIPVKKLVATTSADEYSDFSKYYEDTFGKNSWTKNRLIVPEKKYTIMPLQADGPLGSSWGYIRVTNGKLKLVGLNYMLTKYKDSSNPDEPIQVTCPCEYEYKVFISDEFDISTLNLK